MIGTTVRNTLDSLASVAVIVAAVTLIWIARAVLSSTARAGRPDLTCPVSSDHRSLENGWKFCQTAALALDLAFELGGRQIAEAHLRPFFVAMTSPALDAHLGLKPITKPLDRQTLVAELPV